MFIVYSLTASDEILPFYIGKTHKKSRRLYEHIHWSKKKKNGNRKENKIRSILDRNAKVVEKILFESEIEKEVFEKEIELIKKYGRLDIKTGILTNHTDGGEGFVGVVYSKETREKMSKAKIGNKINVGRKRPDMVKIFSKEISSYDEDGNYLKTYNSARLAQEDTGIHFGLISDILVGRTIKAKDKNKNFISFSFVKSDRIIIRSRKDRSKEVIQIDPTTNLVVAEFKNGVEAAKSINKSQAAIVNAIKRNGKSGGFFWKFK